MTASAFNSLMVVRPMAVTADMLVDTNVPEDDCPAWSSGAAYAVDDRVIFGGAIWQAVQGPNTGHQPPTGAANDGWWLRVSATNRWKAFDDAVNTQTAQADSISYRVRAGTVISALAALNVTGATAVRVRVLDPTYGAVYDRTAELAPYPVESDWWEFFFGEWIYPSQSIFDDLPNFPFADILIDFTGSADLAVGVIVLGNARNFGYGVKLGAQLGFNDYSRKDKDDFGNITIVQRAYSRRDGFSMMIDRTEVDACNAFFSDLRATVILCVASNYYESLTIFGLCKSFNVLISYYQYSDCDIEMDGVI